MTLVHWDCLLTWPIIRINIQQISDYLNLFFFFFWSHRLSKNRWLTPLPLPGNKSSQIYWKKTTAEQREEADPSPNQTVSRRLLSKNMSTLSFPPVTTCSRRGSKYWFHTDVSVFPDDHIFFFTFYCKYTLVWLLITYIAAALREPLMVDPLYKVHGDHW